jgi:regulator of protease activity HflC (stomatin/prohibitin superfamily)
MFGAIHRGNPTPDLLAYRYLETLPQLADGQATKLFMVPSDALQQLGGLAAFGAAFQTGQDAAMDPNGAKPGQQA